MVEVWTGGAQFTLLVQFEVRVDDRSVLIKSSNEWSLLARLALEHSTAVPSNSLIEAISPDDKPSGDRARAVRYHVAPVRPTRAPSGRALRRHARAYPTCWNLLAFDLRAVDSVRLEAGWFAACRLGDHLCCPATGRPRRGRRRRFGRAEPAPIKGESELVRMFTVAGL